MQDLKWLETFIWVARLGGFRAAATKLNTTQPAISARVEQLEIQLGVALFSPDSRRRRPTREGMVLLDYAERILALNGELRNALARPDSVHGVLRIGVAESLVHSLMPRLLEAIGATYPRVVLDLVVDTTNVLREQLREGIIDISMQVGSVADPRAVNRHLCHFPLGWVASPALPLPETPMPLAALSPWPVLSFSHNCPLAADIQRAISSAGADADGAPPVRLWGSASLTLMVRMALDRQCICILPLALAAEEIRQGRLRMLQVADVRLPSNAFQVSYLQRRDSHLAAMVAERAVAIGLALEAEHRSDKVFRSLRSKTTIRQASCRA